jgi:pyruvate formate lyase activating enzyme
MAQPDFALSLARILKTAGIRVNVETCGVFRWTNMEKLLASIDLVYFDLKLMDGKRHRQWTGADNRPLLENFALLSRRFENLQARMPVIPGLNDDEDNVRALARFLRGLGRTSVHCLPYHDLGEAKIPRIHTAQEPLRVRGDAALSMAAVKIVLKREGIHAVIYD